VRQIEADALARIRRRLERWRPTYRTLSAESPRVGIEVPDGSNASRPVVLRTRRGAVVREFAEADD